VLLGAPKRTSTGPTCSVEFLSYHSSSQSIANAFNRSDSASGTIHFYDGRGGDTPLDSVTSLHRFPVHLMAVSSFAFPSFLGFSPLSSTATNTTPLFLQMRVASLNTVNHQSPGACPRMCQDYGLIRAQQTCMSSKR
jgi:hypothetical protein